jgi:hypothetical protein
MFSKVAKIRGVRLSAGQSDTVEVAADSQSLAGAAEGGAFLAGIAMSHCRFVSGTTTNVIPSRSQ